MNCVKLMIRIKDFEIGEKKRKENRNTTKDFFIVRFSMERIFVNFPWRPHKKCTKSKGLCIENVFLLSDQDENKEFLFLVNFFLTFDDFQSNTSLSSCIAKYFSTLLNQTNFEFRIK